MCVKDSAIAISPMAQATEAINKEINIHQLRIENLANRNKGYRLSEDVSVQTLHLEGMDRRNKGYEHKEGYSL